MTGMPRKPVTQGLYALGIVSYGHCVFLVPRGHTAVLYNFFDKEHPRTIAEGPFLETKNNPLKLGVFEVGTNYKLGTQNRSYTFVANSRDNRKYFSDVTVQYHLNAFLLPHLHKKLGPHYVDQIDNTIEDHAMYLLASFSAAELDQQEKQSTMNSRLLDAMKQTLDPFGIVVEDTAVKMQEVELAQQPEATVVQPITTTRQDRHRFTL